MNRVARSIIRGPLRRRLRLLQRAIIILPDGARGTRAVGMADIFVSYTSSDRDWAFWIAKELQALDHTPHVHEWEIEGGADIYAWMQTRVDAADHVLCVISDDYLKAPYSTLERNAALWQAAAKRPGFVLLVAVKPCTIPALSDHIRRCELFGVPEDAARIRFREFMSKREAPAAASFPGKLFAVSNIPIRVPEHFMGRDDALEAIDAALKRYEGRVAITALHGLRGVGKTTLAATYAERHRSDYRATWWIRAQTEPTMRADLVALGVRLGWVMADEKEEPALTTVMERSRHEGDGLLLVYDNAVDAKTLKPYLPPGGRAQVLVTSNAHAWRGVAAPVEIRLWSKEIGADYLIARTGREAERNSALALSEALGGLPLAHEQAAAYCERLDLTLAEYARRFQTTPATFLDDARDAPMDYHDGLTVAKTFALAIDEAAKLHPAVEPLILHAALLAPEPIPLFLFSEARQTFGEPFASALARHGLDEAIAALRSFAVIDRDAIRDESDPTITTECIRLHRLVRQVVSFGCDLDVQDRARRALIEAVAAVYPDDLRLDPRSALTRIRRLDALALGLVSGPVPAHTEKWTSELLIKMGGYRQFVLAAFTQAEPLFERAVSIRERVLGPDHPDTAKSLRCLANLLMNQHDMARARPLLERALSISEKVLGPENRDTAKSLSGLAILLRDRGNFARARRLLERALAINETVLGSEHPDTAENLSALGNLARERGNAALMRGRLVRARFHFRRARPLLERALAINEKMFGPEHLNTLESLNDVITLRMTRRDFTGAQPLLERALAMNEKTFGPEHPKTGEGLNYLGDLLVEQRDLTGARLLLERALAINEKVFGREHLNTASSLYNLGHALRRQGDIAEARSLLKRALAICNKVVLAPEYPYHARDLKKQILWDLIIIGELAIYKKVRGFISRPTVELRS
jgi:tetratricopeptide (TPR) repeat protein